MSTPETTQERYDRAKKRVDQLKGFYNHAVIYILVNLGLAGLNYYQNGLSNPWFLFTTFGWGIGLAAHALSTLRWNPLMSKDWEERKLKEFMDKDI